MLKQFIPATTKIIMASFAVSIVIMLFSTAHSFSQFIDILFLLSLLSFLFGAALHLVEGGFFLGITYSFKRFFSKMSRQGRYAAELFGESEQLQETTTYSYTKPLLMASLIQLIITLLLSFTILS